MNTTILDYIVNTIEALFYILTGVIALLTYLSARKTILQPVKTEASKPQEERPSSPSADFSRFYNFKAIKIPENESFPGFFYIHSICSGFEKSDRI